VNRLIHEKNRDYTFFMILFDDPYDFVVQRSCVEFESHRVCRIVKSYDFTSKLSILITMLELRNLGLRGVLEISHRLEMRFFDSL